MKKIFHYLLELLESVTIAVIVAFICFNFVFFPAQVQGSSMYPTLVDGDRGISFIITKEITIKRFDICVIDSEKATDLLVKRIIGMPNETIEYRNNVLYIDGIAYKEDYLSSEIITEDFSYTLGEDEYFCLGDNRGVSRDSRYYGPFTSSEIKSTKFFTFFPLSRLGSK